MIKRPLLLFVFTFLALFGMVACNSNLASVSNPTPTVPIDSSATTPTSSLPSPALGPLHIAKVNTEVNLDSFSGMACGTVTDLVYTATITADAGSGGGTVTYTWNVGRSNQSGRVTFAPGETSKVVSYTLSGFVVEPGTVTAGFLSVRGSDGMVATSIPVQPTGVCSYEAPFTVQSVALSVNPASVAGLRCNSTIQEVFTAVITVAPNSPGGTVQFTWTVGSYNRALSVAFGPGETVRTLNHAKSDVLTPGSTIFPAAGTVATTSPNVVSSTTVKPTGTCQ